MRKSFLLALFGATLVNAQGISVGLIGGAPFADVAKTTVIGAVSSLPRSSNFTIGPVLQVNLPKKFRLEVDALFRPYKVDIGTLIGVRPATSSVDGKLWRFPALLQYRFGSSRIQPFVGAGLSFGHLSGLSAAAKSFIASGPGALANQSDASPVAGVGVDVKLPLLRISGELRFTRQSVANFASISNLNQAEFLLGIHF